DTHPGKDDMTSVMIIGHADKIRMQVRKIDSDGKIWVNTDSFLPCTLIGHEVKLFSQQPKKPGTYRCIEGGTIEALGAIHFSEPAQRTGDKGLKPEMIYLELQMHGEKCKERVEALGIRPGDPIILNRPIKQGFSDDTFYGAYLDNGLGCFVVAEIAKILAKAKLKNIRVLYTIATHEEIGRFGATAIAGELKPDILIGSDVNHDYDAAPGIGAKRMNPLTMGKGFTLTNGSITSEYINNLIETVCQKENIPYQIDFAGRDTGTDAMAASLAGIDSPSKMAQFSSEWAGESVASKLARVREQMQLSEADWLIETQPDNVNWLLNIRGQDLPYCPVVRARLLIGLEGEVHLFGDFITSDVESLDKSELSIHCHARDQFMAILDERIQTAERLWLDPTQGP
ncbi:MAG: aminopeptidase P family N-terminal domain-containing protein, partial [Akkermansiaceae bacterium]